MKIFCGLLLALATLEVQAQQASIRLGINATLTLERAPFKAAGKVLTFYDSKQPNVDKLLSTIDGKPVFGTDGAIPKFILKQAVLILDGRPYKLRVDNMYNPWFGDGLRYGPGRDSAKLIKKGNTYELQAVFADGAGTYRAGWVINGKSSKRIMLSADDEIVTNYYRRK